MKTMLLKCMEHTKEDPRMVQGGSESKSGIGKWCMHPYTVLDEASEGNKLKAMKFK